MIPKTYPLATVLKVLDLTEDTATNWARRGMQGLVVEPSGRGRGRSRMIGIEAIVRLAIMQACAKMGIAPNRSANWATIAIRLMNDGVDFKFLYIRWYRETEESEAEESILPDDNLMEEAPRPGADIVLRLDIRAIVDRVQNVLDSIGADKG